MTMDHKQLEELLLDAHARNDGDALVGLYTLAADQSETTGNIDAACFYLTHAFVFGLQNGSAATRDLQMRLWRYGAKSARNSPAGNYVNTAPAIISRRVGAILVTP